MKNLLENINTKSTINKDKVLERYIDTKDEEIRIKTKEQASADASLGLPRSGQDTSVFSHGIHSDYQSVMSFTAKELQAKSEEQDYLNEHDRDVVEKKQKENRETISQFTHDRQSHLIEANRIIETTNREVIPWVYFGFFVAFIANSILDARAFSNGLNEGLWVAASIGVLVAASICILAKLSPMAIETWSSNKYQKIGLAVATVLLVFGITYLIGTFRSVGTGVELLGSEALPTNTNSPLVFAIINTFVFLVEFLAAIFLLPTREEEKKYNAKRKHLSKVEEIDKEIKRLHQENSALENEFNALKKERMKRVFYSDYIFDYINGKYKACWNLYLQENSIKRRDNYTPQITSIPELNNHKTK